jgi:alpha-tubulin suppressor-like RCC1 family protein
MVTCRSTPLMRLCAAEGEVFSWGAAASGRLGLGVGKRGLWESWGQANEFLPRTVRRVAEEGVVGVSAGHMHSGCVTSDGRALMWGAGRFRHAGRGAASSHCSSCRHAG